MTNITEFNSTPCPQIDPLQVNAYLTLSLDEVNNNLLKLDTSWGCTEVDLAPVVRRSETVTTLFITPEDSLQFNREDYGVEGALDGGVDCISGHDLSQIVSMRYLKDVSQNNLAQPGDVYMFDNDTQLFQPFDLQTFTTNVSETLEQHGSAITNITGTLQSVQNTLATVLARLAAVEKRLQTAETNISNLQSRMATVEATLAKPTGIPSNTRLAWGNCNIYGDCTNANDLTHGVYTHNPANRIVDDMYNA